MINRRTLLAALPVSGLAAALPAQASLTDPVVPLYHEWLAARAEWERLSEIPGNEDFDSPESIVADQRADAALDAMIELTPTSAEGVAALVHVLWHLKGPCFRADRPEYLEECEYPRNKALISLWRATSGRSDHPMKF